MSEGWRTPTPKDWVAEFVDESDPDSPVSIHRADGDMGGAMVVPQEMFLELRRTVMRYTGADVTKLPATLAHLKP